MRRTLRSRRSSARALLAVAVALAALVGLPSAFLPPPTAAPGLMAGIAADLDVETGAMLPPPASAAIPAEVMPASTASTAALAASSSRAASGRTARNFGTGASTSSVLAALPALKAGSWLLRRCTQRRSSASKEDLVAETTTVVLPVLGAFVGWVAAMYAIQHGIITLPFLPPEQALYFPIIATFVAGYAVIILEEQTEISKAAAALVLGVVIWALVGTGLDLSPDAFQKDIKETLEEVAEVVFFLLGALTIVEIMDAHKGFDIITNSITATKKSELLVIIGVLTFILSSVLNNLTVVIVMVSLVQKLVKDQEFRQRIGGVIVIASNCGGAWTPIGDITTTMLYIGGQVTTVPLLVNLFVPSVLCLVGAVGFEYLRTDREETFERPSTVGQKEEPTPNGQALVFWVGLLGMVTVPVFQAVTQCPPWSGMMLVLGLLGVITSLLHEPNDERYSLKGALTRVEVPDALFFLGVLFAVGGLERVGLLKELAVQLSSVVPSDAIVAILLGFASAVVDNVPLVAATQGMYDLTAHPANDALWNLITYCSATGGSLLVIGSAAGVAFMGLEKGVSFGWYTANVAPAALIGYFFGVAGILAQQSFGLSIS